MEKICPKCGFANSAATGTAYEACPRCGVIYSKIEAMLASPPSAKIAAKPKKQQEPASEIVALNSNVNGEVIAWAMNCVLPCTIVIVWLAAVPHMDHTVADYQGPLLLACGVWLCIFLFLKLSQYQENSSKAHLAHLSAVLSQGGYTINDAVRGWHDERMIVIDENKRCVALFSSANPRWHRLVPFENLLSVELHEDGQTIGVTSGGASFGRALVGRALFGVAGEVIGGTTGRRTTTSFQRASSIELRLVIKDVKDPTWDLAFLSAEISKDTPAYKAISQRARQVAGSLSAAIAIAKEEKTAQNPV